MIQPWLKEVWTNAQPPQPDSKSPNFWFGGIIGLISLVALVSGTAGFLSRFFWLSPIVLLIGGVLSGIGIYFASTFLLGVLLKLLDASSKQIIVAIGGALIALLYFRLMPFRWPSQVYQPAIWILMGLSILLGGSLAILLHPKRSRPKSNWAWLGLVLGTTAIVWGLSWVQSEGKPSFPLSFERLSPSPSLMEQGVVDPSLPGDFAYQEFTYGSGNDRKRVAFSTAVRYKTSSVDAKNLLPDWKGKKKKWREKYWGFGVDSFPLNGRVFLPERNSPAPLVLMVHGNHAMEDYSDEGYAYLGELLASQGMIAVSVDENFLNGTWSGDFRGKEMPTRAWLLLKHLEQWSIWSRDANHELYQKADLNRVILIGHSRGGEAVSIAAAFNELPRFPDNAKETFNFGYGIRGVVAIAPTDYRYDRQMELENVHFLSLQGSYDADESGFFGLRQYQRVSQNDTLENWLKAGIYVHGANHGQFNSTWDRTDFGAPYSWLLNTHPIISREHQEKVAKVFISAFAQLAVGAGPKAKTYRSLFKHTGHANDWLPVGIYLGHYKDSHATILANFEEDIDIAREPKGILTKAILPKIWREEQLKYRNNLIQGNNAVVLGWDYGDSLRLDSLTQYQLHFPDSFSKGSTELLFTAAAGDPNILPKFKGEDPDLDITIVLQDTSGQNAQLVLSQHKALAPRLKVQYTKSKKLDKQQFSNSWEVTTESFAIPWRAFEAAESFNFNAIEQVNFVFDQTPKGVIFLDEIGFGS
ncbi:MAG: hypothetical protein KTR30_24265 [Saprospiraceae bacterium]|nr:hypothetical protein [Saprospiraceae bacterium]